MAAVFQVAYSPMTSGLTFEVCVDSTESALAAEQGGAQVASSFAAT
jgi:hypothetical protein